MKSMVLCYFYLHILIHSKGLFLSANVLSLTHLFLRIAVALSAVTSSFLVAFSSYWSWKCEKPIADLC